MQKLAGILTESQYEDLTLEPEDMDNPDEDLVIIGSGYLDIKNNSLAMYAPKYLAMISNINKETGKIYFVKVFRIEKKIGDT